MKLEKLAAVGEIVSSVAIVFTLAFLALQMQQNTRALEASASQAAANAESNVLLQALDDPEIIISLSKEELTDEEVIKLFGYLSLVLRAHEQYWGQYQFGVLDEATMRRFENALIGQLSFPSSRNWWNSVKGGVDPEFSGRVDRLLENAAVSNGSSATDNMRSAFRLNNPE